jgi:hypothetical protein
MRESLIAGGHVNQPPSARITIHFNVSLGKATASTGMRAAAPSGQTGQGLANAPVNENKPVGGIVQHDSKATPATFGRRRLLVIGGAGKVGG